MTYQRLRFISGIILVIGHVFWLDQAMGLITGQILMGLSGKDFFAVLLFTLGAVGILLSSYHQKWLLLTAIANMWSYLFILWETTLSNHPPSYITQLTTDYVLSTTSRDATIAHITAGIIASSFMFFAVFQDHIWKVLRIIGNYALPISAIIYGSIQVFIFYNFMHIARLNDCHADNNAVCQPHDLPTIALVVFSIDHLVWVFAYIILIFSDKNLYHLIFRRNKLVL